MKVLFDGLVIIFEAGKFYAWHEFGSVVPIRIFRGL